MDEFFQGQCHCFGLDLVLTWYLQKLLASERHLSAATVPAHHSLSGMSRRSLWGGVTLCGEGSEKGGKRQAGDKRCYSSF